MYDLVIVGGGIAGLCAALSAPAGARIVVIDKGESGAGSSPLAQGGLAAAVGHEDSVELHAKDTIVAGAGICDEAVVEDVCSEGPRAIHWLTSLGCRFDRRDDSELHLAREGGQSVARSVHWRDATGAEIVRALRAAVDGRNVERIQAHTTKLTLRDGRCNGVIAGGRWLGARGVLLATGGAGGLWAATTNAPGATGDGVALALVAGAQAADLEFMQFHPTALAGHDPQRVLLTEALRGHGAILINASGERFVDELGPRNIVAKAILDQGAAYLDCRHIADLERMFPTVVEGARAHGFDPVTQPLPVMPAAHYFIGGVAADARGYSSTPGLFAAGECASTGMHGANRMAGNSLLETVVVGMRVGASFMDEPDPPGGWFGYAPEVGQLAAVDARVPDIMWNGVGPIRDEAGISSAISELEVLDDTPHRSLCALIARAALRRTETRGVHIRSDLPASDPASAQRSFDRM